MMSFIFYTVQLLYDEKQNFQKLSSCLTLMSPYIIITLINEMTMQNFAKCQQKNQIFVF